MRYCSFCPLRAKWKVGGDDDGPSLHVCHRHSETALEAVCGAEGVVQRLSAVSP